MYEHLSTHRKWGHTLKLLLTKIRTIFHKREYGDEHYNIQPIVYPGADPP